MWIESVLSESHTTSHLQRADYFQFLRSSHLCCIGIATVNRQDGCSEETLNFRANSQHSLGVACSRVRQSIQAHTVLYNTNDDRRSTIDMASSSTIRSKQHKLHCSKQHKLHHRKLVRTSTSTFRSKQHKLHCSKHHKLSQFLQPRLWNSLIVIGHCHH
jgi:hypothetical protein